MPRRTFTLSQKEKLQGKKFRYEKTGYINATFKDLQASFNRHLARVLGDPEKDPRYKKNKGVQEKLQIKQQLIQRMKKQKKTQ